MEMYLAGVSVRRVDDITKALWGSRVSPSMVSELNRKIYGQIEVWRNRPIEEPTRLRILGWHLTQTLLGRRRFLALPSIPLLPLGIPSPLADSHSSFPPSCNLCTPAAVPSQASPGAPITSCANENWHQSQAGPAHRRPPPKHAAMRAAGHVPRLLHRQPALAAVRGTSFTPCGMPPLVDRPDQTPPERGSIQVFLAWDLHRGSRRLEPLWCAGGPVR